MTKIALCLPGGGVTGAMFQIGALSALEDLLAGFDATVAHVHVGASSGATVAAALAGGVPAQRMYRALNDPADVFFPLERRHILRVDLGEWRRVAGAAIGALRNGGPPFLSRAKAPSPEVLWEELDRIVDSLPTGLFGLDGYERFLEEFFARRGVANNFGALRRPLRIVAHDLDSGGPAVFGAEGLEHVPVSRACIASAALPPFFSPVRIGDRVFVDAGSAQVALLDAAVAAGADALVVVNPMVPVRIEGVRTAQGHRPSVRDKGYLWVANQALRIGIHAQLREAIARIRAATGIPVVLLEPDPTDGVLFMFSSTSFAGRRTMLEYAYRRARDRVLEWFADPDSELVRAGFRERGPGDP